MPRDVTALGGLETGAEQFPISLVQFAIPSFSYNEINDTDFTVYLNTSTNAVAMASGAGLTAFAPYAGMEVPQLEETETRPLSEVRLRLANIYGDWSTVVAANAYRETEVKIWQGNLVMAAGTAPEGVTFQGAVKTFVGRIEDIQPGKEWAEIFLAPHITSWAMMFPYRDFSAFKHVPPPGHVVTFGNSEREL